MPKFVITLKTLDANNNAKKAYIHATDEGEAFDTAKTAYGDDVDSMEEVSENEHKTRGEI